MHPISRPRFCGPRSPIHEWARSGPWRGTTIWGTWTPNLSPPIEITYPADAAARTLGLAGEGLVQAGLVLRPDRPHVHAGPVLQLHQPLAGGAGPALHQYASRKTGVRRSLKASIPS